MSRISHRARLRVATATMTLAVTALSTSALGAGWPAFGGDSGHSGHQVVDPGTLPVTQRWAATAASDRDVRTSVVVTGGGSDAGSSAAYGTGDGHLHLQRLSDGGPRGPESGADADDGPSDADVFTGDTGSVTPAETSTGPGDGMLLALHNDDDQDGRDTLGNGGADPRSGGDVALAIVDLATGFMVADQAVGGSDPAGEETINMTISSSPVLGPVLPGPTPARELFFIARRAAADVDPVASATPCSPNASFDVVGPGNLRGCRVPAETRLFRLLVTDPGSVNAQVASVTSVQVAANPRSSPTLLRLDDPATDPATPRDYVAVGTADGYVRAFDRATLAAGPVSPDLGNAVSTPSVPVRSNGEPAGVDPPIFVAVATAADSFRVYRLRRATTPGQLEVADTTTGQSATLPGLPSPAPAVSVLADAVPAGGRVLVAASRNLYSFDAIDLRDGDGLDLSNALTPGTTGFSRTTPALQNGLAYVQRDDGAPLVLDERTLEPAAGFNRWPDPDGVTANEGIGQPAISRGFVVFGHADGVFAYRNETAPVIDIVAPTEGATLTGTTTVRATAYNLRSGISRVTFFLSGVAAGDGALVSGSPTSATDPGTYELSIDTTRFGNGLYSLTATTTDGDAGQDAPGESATSATRPVKVANSAPPQPPADPQPEVPVLSISSATAREGRAGESRSLSFDVSLSRAAAGAVTVDFATADGTARANADYTAQSGSVTIPAGELSRSITVGLLGDDRAEPGEFFEVVLSNVRGAGLGNARASALIVDDEPAGEAARLAPTRVTLSVKPRLDRRAPFRFRATGRLVAPTAVAPAAACSGRVSVQVKAGRKTISTRRVRLRANCAYSSRVAFTSRGRLTSDGRLRFTARFLGNAALTPKKSKAVVARTR